MNTTYRLKASEIYKDWHVIDAAGRPLGRVATEAATLLRGKHKPTFEPHLDAGDFVIVINASKVVVTGNKAAQNRYYRHSGYPGGLKSRSYTEQLEKYPDRVIEQCVWGMLPKGSLGEKIIKHLKVYRGPNHPHASQITGSERAKAVREASLAEIAEAPAAPAIRIRMKPNQPSLAAAAITETAAAPAPRATAPVAEAPVAAAPVAEAAVVEEPTAAAPVEQPTAAPATPRRARKADVEGDATADAPEATATAEAAEATSEAPKPARTRRRTPKTEE